MNKSFVVATAAIALVGVGTHSPASAAKKPAKKPPITKSYSMNLLPVPDPPQGTPSCARAQLEGVSIHTETFTTTGAGTLSAEVSGFAGDWDITVYDTDGLVGVGDGTSTGGGAPATSGKDTFVNSWKKGTTITVKTCNFAGSPQAKGSYTFTYK